jgi:minor extracellular serine protease Vpr
MSDYPGRCLRLALITFFISAFPVLAQYTNRFALILADPPVAERFTGRAGAQSVAARGYRNTIEARQAALKGVLAARNITVARSVSTLSNAVFVVSDPSRVDELRALPGVIGVVRMRKLHRNLNAATRVVNAPAAWTVLGGESNAGRGVKIGIIDTGIDQTHAAFQDASLAMPAGFPKCTDGHPED